MISFILYLAFDNLNLLSISRSLSAFPLHLNWLLNLKLLLSFPCCKCFGRLLYFYWLFFYRKHAELFYHFLLAFFPLFLPLLLKPPFLLHLLSKFFGAAADGLTPAEGILPIKVEVRLSSSLAADPGIVPLHLVHGIFFFYRFGLIVPRWIAM
jgi:hypothetical protein